MSIQSLLNTLEQKVQQLTQAYQTDSDKKINAKFNRTLFTEDFETVGFYLKEIQQSLTKLCKIPHQNEEQIVFMAEHLLGQCTALTEAMNRKKQNNLLQAVNHNIAFIVSLLESV